MKNSSTLPTYLLCYTTQYTFFHIHSLFLWVFYVIFLEFWKPTLSCFCHERINNCHWNRCLEIDAAHISDFDLLTIRKISLNRHQTVKSIRTSSIITFLKMLWQFYLIIQPITATTWLLYWFETTTRITIKFIPMPHRKYLLIIIPRFQRYLFLVLIIHSSKIYALWIGLPVV